MAKFSSETHQQCVATRRGSSGGGWLLSSTPYRVLRTEYKTASQRLELCHLIGVSCPQFAFPNRSITWQSWVQGVKMTDWKHILSWDKLSPFKVSLFKWIIAFIAIPRLFSRGSNPLELASPASIAASLSPPWRQRWSRAEASKSLKAD